MAVTGIHKTNLFKYRCHYCVLMFVALAIVITAIVSMVVGFSIQQQLTYGQANITEENMTVSEQYDGDKYDQRGSGLGYTIAFIQVQLIVVRTYWDR